MLRIYLSKETFCSAFNTRLDFADKEYAVEVTNGTFTWSSPEGGEDEEGGENRETGAPTLSE